MIIQSFLSGLGVLIGHHCVMFFIIEQRSDLDIFLTQEANNALENGGDESPSWQQQKKLLLADQDDDEDEDDDEDLAAAAYDKVEEEEKGKYVLLVDQEFEWRKLRN